MVLSHYLIPYDQATPREPAASQFDVDGDLAVGDAGGVNLVTWASPNLEQALLGSAPSSEMVALARESIGS